MKYVQRVRGKWVVRMIVPEELRQAVGQQELVEIGLPDETRARENRATAIINAFHARLDEAREQVEALAEASTPTLSSAAKSHFRSELVFDDLERAAGLSDCFMAVREFNRSVYATHLRLLVAGKIEDDEAEALIGYAADRRCCRTLTAEDSHRESMRLDRAHEQAITRPLPHDELVQLHCLAS